jgi:hypothetical protein
MSDSEAGEGREIVTTFEVPIERGKVREFAVAAGATAQLHFGPEAVTPATFLITASTWAPESARIDVGFDRKRLLHGEQEFRFNGAPPVAGQMLTASSRLVERYEKSGGRGGLMKFAVVLTEFRNEAGVVVADSRTTLIERASMVSDDS